MPCPAWGAATEAQPPDVHGRMQARSRGSNAYSPLSIFTELGLSKYRLAGWLADWLTEQKLASEPTEVLGLMPAE